MICATPRMSTPVPDLSAKSCMCAFSLIQPGERKLSAPPLCPRIHRLVPPIQTHTGARAMRKHTNCMTSDRNTGPWRPSWIQKCLKTDYGDCVHATLKLGTSFVGVEPDAAHCLSLGGSGRTGVGRVRFFSWFVLFWMPETGRRNSSTPPRPSSPS